MSVVSSRVSSVSSILKSPGARSKLIRQSNRVYFKLPKDIKSIICKFEAGNGTKDYNDLRCMLLNDSDLKDQDLIEFLSKVKGCISLLSPTHKVFVETLLQIKWTNRSLDVTSAYKAFLVDLICMQIYYAKNVIDNLVEQFKPDEDDSTEWENGECEEKDIQRLNHIHDVLRKILEVVPMSSKLLLKSLRARFPYNTNGTHVHETYVYALLQILEYAPQLRSDILSMIVNRLVMLDINIPRLEIENEEEEDSMDDSDCDSMLNNENNVEENNVTEADKVHPIAHTLDVCMELILNYMHDFCFVNEVLQIERLKNLYFDVLHIFETVILPTHGSQYVQYIMFYICSFKTTVVEAFVDWLLLKIFNPNVPSVIRQSSAAYISSLLITGRFISTRLVKEVQYRMSEWIHDYINMQNYLNYIEDENKKHSIFYCVCQALFLIIAKRHNDYSDSKKYMLYLQELELAKIITCKLNPLKYCHPEIVRNFAEIAQMYQLAYCYTIIENNRRSQLPLFNSKKTVTFTIENFSPFNCYTLHRSGQRIISLLHENINTSDHRTTIKCREDIEFMNEY